MAGELEFLFELDAKIDGVLKMLDAVDRSVKGLHQLDQASKKAEGGMEHVERASNHAAGAHRAHGHAVWQLGHQYEYVKNGIREFGEAIGIVLAFEAVEKLVEKVKELGEEVIHAAASAERFEVSFKGLLGEELGEGTLKWIESIGVHTEFSVERLKQLAASLLQVGFRGKDLTRALEASVDIAGLPGGNLEAASNSLEQLKRRGQINNRILGGIGYGENDFFAEMATRTGKSREALKKEMEKGTLDTKEALEALYTLINRKTGKDLGDFGVEMSKTVAAKLTHVKELPERLAEGLSTTDGYKRFSEGLGNLLESFDTESPTGKRIFKNLDLAFGKFVDVLSKIDVEKFSNTLMNLFEKLPGMVEQTTHAIIGLAKAISSITGISGGPAATKALGPGATGMLPGTAGTKVSPFIGTAQNIRLSEAQQKDIAGFQNWFKKWLHIGAGAGEAMAKGMLDKKPEVAGAGAEVAETALGGTAKKLDAHSPSRKFEELGRMSAEGYIEGMDKSGGRIDAAVARAMATDSVPPGAFARPAGGMAFGPVQVTVNVDTTVHPQGSGGNAPTAEEIGEQVSAQVRDATRVELQRILEQLGLEAGA